MVVSLDSLSSLLLLLPEDILVPLPLDPLHGGLGVTEVAHVSHIVGGEHHQRVRRHGNQVTDRVVLDPTVPEERGRWRRGCTVSLDWNNMT